MGKLAIIEGGRSRAARFEALIGPCYDTLYRVAYRLTRSVADAEDLVQDLMIRAYPRVDELEALDDPRGWLLCVLRRIYIDHTRRYDRKHGESIETVDDHLLVSPVPGPAEHVEQSLQAERLERAWRRLGRDQQSLLAMHDIEGYSLAELVEITGLKEGTLKSRLHRARVKLGRMLKADEQDTPRAAAGE